MLFFYALMFYRLISLCTSKAVHKKLEEAIPMVEVIVKVKSAEEKFALQYVLRHRGPFSR